MEELLKNLISEYALTFALLATLTVPLVTELFFTHVWQPATKLLNSLMVFVISLAVTFVAWPVSGWLDIGFLSEFTDWWRVALWGVGAGVVAQFTWANVDLIYTVIRFLVTLKPAALSQKRK